MKVVAFVTSPEYAKLAEGLEASCEKWEIPFTLYECDHKPTWAENVNYKPEIVRQALESSNGDPVLYVDADAYLYAYPELLRNPDQDFAAYYQSPKQPCGGSLWFRPSKRMKAVVDLWCRLVEERPNHADDWVNLRDALDSDRYLPKLHLPPAYNWHPATMRQRFPGAKPVIVHGCVGQHNYKVYQ